MSHHRSSPYEPELPDAKEKRVVKDPPKTTKKTAKKKAKKKK
jgi:hypothetical protein